MIKCWSFFDKTLKEFYKENKEYNDYQLLGKIIFIKWEIGHYYGIVDKYGAKHILKCQSVDSAGKNPVFTSDTSYPGSLTLDSVLWEKSEEEMFKSDCK